jgi:hypothetical protein
LKIWVDFSVLMLYLEKIKNKMKLIDLFKVKNLYTRGGQPAAQTGISAAQTRIENQRFFDIFGVIPCFLLLCGPKSQDFWQIFQVAAQRPIWVGHPSFLRYYFS